MTKTKAILITGCSSGIGKASALRLAASAADRGWTIWASARDTGSLTELAAVGCKTLALDVSDADSAARAVASIEAEHGAVSVLVNNAGYAQSGAIEAVPLARVRKQFETNFFGLVHMTQLVLPRMRAQRWGRIVNMSSMGGRLVFPGAGYYHATKYAVEAISDALRFEVRGFGIGVSLIEPGLIKSNFVDAARGHFALGDNSPYEAFHRAIEQGTVALYERGFMSKLTGTPDDVAKVVERAIVAKRPRSRYTVSASATLLLTQRAMLSDGMWDAMMGSNFPSPGHVSEPAV